MIKPLAKQAWRQLYSRLYVDLGHGAEDAVFLSGTERSGTTWVAETINHARRFRFMFEPFWNKKVPECMPITPQEYIRHNDRSPERLAAASTIIEGKVRNQWVDQYHRSIVAHKRLLKDVRSNLYLRWLKEVFPQMPVVLLLRHPCAVAKSQFERKHAFPSCRETFLAQTELVEDFLEPLVHHIDQSLTPFEDRIFRWCIQNYVPLQQFQIGEIHVAFYERLCIDPDNEYRQIFEFLGMPFESGVSGAASRPSPMSQQDSPVVTGEDLVDSWRKSVTPADVSAAVEILGLFGLDRLYGSESLPLDGGLAGVMGA